MRSKSYQVSYSDRPEGDNKRLLPENIRRIRSLPDYAGFHGAHEQRVYNGPPGKEQLEQAFSGHATSADLCTRCRRIDALTLSSEDRSVLSASCFEVLANGAECVLCKLLSKSIERRGSQDSEGYRLSMSDRVSVDQHSRVWGGDSWSFYLTGQGHKGTVSFSLATLHVSYLAGDPAVQMLPGLRKRIVGTSTLSRESSAVARKWLADCEDWHHWLDEDARSTSSSILRSPEDYTDIRPSRLIDCFADLSQGASIEIGNADLKVCKLVESPPRNVSYVALSYCWGQLVVQYWVTTQDNLAQRLHSLDEQALPKTLSDAVAIARSLHIRYLWVDSLCIVQDSTADWLAESGKMGAIFANASLTICAPNASNSHAGIFNSSSISVLRERPSHHLRIAVPGNVPGNRPSVLQLLLEDQAFKPLREELAPENQLNLLAKRMWCYQEELLSRRKVYYFEEQLYWSCPHLKQSEDRFYSHWMPLDNLAVSSHGPAYIWYVHIVQDGYSDRQASHASDRLIALSGIARRASSAMNSRYLAGIWQSSLVEGLLWYTERQPNVHSAPAYDPSTAYSAPSWSWASQNSQVGFFWPDLGKPWRQCTFVNAHIDLASDDPFGAVAHGSLTVRSILVNARLQPTTFTPPTHSLQDVMVVIELDDGKELCVWATYLDRRDPYEDKVLALLVTSRKTDVSFEVVLLLLDATPFDGRYKRVGTARESVGWKAFGRTPRAWRLWEELFDSRPDTEVTII